jgi:hypothetical protein
MRVWVLAICLFASQAFGQSNPGGVWDFVKDFGASPSSDVTVNLQNAINTLCALKTPQSLLIDAGKYTAALQPVVISCPNLTIYGVSPEASQFQSTTQYNGSQFVVISPSIPTLPTGPSLVSGSPSSLAVNGKHQVIGVGLSDVSASTGHSAFANGLIQFDMRAWVNATGYDSGSNTYVISSTGSWSPHDPNPDAFDLGISPFGNNWSCSLGILPFGATTPVRYGLASPNSSTLLSGIHELECSWDGSNIRLFVDGAIVSTVAATGTLNQPIYQEAQIGSPMGFAFAGAGNATIAGLIGPVEIANVARNVAPYTPDTSAWGCGPGCLAYWDGSGTLGMIPTPSIPNPTFPKIFTTVQTFGGKPIIEAYNTDYNSGSLQNGMGPIFIDNLTLNSLQLTGAPKSVLDNLNFNAGVRGLVLRSNDFETAITNTAFSGSRGCRYEFQISGAGSGVLAASNINMNGCAVEFGAGGDVSINAASNWSFVPNVDTYFPALWRPAARVDEWSCLGCLWDTESQLARTQLAQDGKTAIPKFQALAGISGPGLNWKCDSCFIAPVSANLQQSYSGGITSQPGGTTYSFWVDGASVTIANTATFLGNPPTINPSVQGLTPTWVHVIGPCLSPISFVHDYDANGGTIPFVDLPGCEANTTASGATEGSYGVSGGILAGDVVCFTGNETVADCLSGQAAVGVAADSSGSVQDFISSGRVIVNLDVPSSPMAGWYACGFFATAGRITAQSTPCVGNQVGIFTSGGTNVTSGKIFLQSK